MKEMIYRVIKKVEDKEIVLYEAQDNIQALIKLNQLIDEHAEELLNTYKDMDEVSAISIAEERFLLLRDIWYAWSYILLKN